MTTSTRTLRDSLLAMTIAALGGAAGCAHHAAPAPAPTTTAQAPTTSGGEPAPASNDLPTATPAPTQPQGVPAGHSCGQGECS